MTQYTEDIVKEGWQLAGYVHAIGSTVKFEYTQQHREQYNTELKGTEECVWIGKLAGIVVRGDKGEAFIDMGDAETTVAHIGEGKRGSVNGRLTIYTEKTDA